MGIPDLKSTILYLDGLRYSLAMAGVAGRRLRSTLDAVADLHGNGQDVEELVNSALLDAWSVVDMCHRTRELVQQTPGLSPKLPGIQIFLRATSEIEGLRHFVQHFRTEIPKVPASFTPLWGGLLWVPTNDQTTCWIIHTGSLIKGSTLPSISYDTHNFRFTAEIVLRAGTATADILVVLSQMAKLYECILERVETHPNFARSEAKTLVLRFSVRPQRERSANRESEAD